MKKSHNIPLILSDKTVCMSIHFTLIRKQNIPPPSPGSQDGKLHMWHAESGSKVATLQSKEENPIHCVQFNPKFMMVATSSMNSVSSKSIPSVVSGSKEMP